MGIPPTVIDRRRIHWTPRIAVLAIAAIAALTLVGCGEADDSAGTASSDSVGTTSASNETTTTAAVDTSSTVPDDNGDQDTTEIQAIWPFTNSGDTYGDPVELVRTFADEYLGFTRLIVGEFEPGSDADSGIVDVMSFEGGTLTRVSVAKLSDDVGWVVVGAENEHLVVESPTAGDTVGSPITVSGRSTAFEGTVDVLIREDGRMDPLGTNFATGGANGEMGPFTTTIDLAEGGAEYGALIVRSQSMEDGGTAEATVVPIRLS